MLFARSRTNWYGMKLNKSTIDKLLLIPLSKRIGASAENLVEVYQCRLVEGLNFQCWVAACDKDGHPLEKDHLSFFLYVSGIKASFVTTLDQIHQSTEQELIRMIRKAFEKSQSPYYQG